MSELMLVAAVLTTVADSEGDTPGKGVPQGPIYMALMERGLSYSAWEQLLAVLRAAGLVRTSPELIWLTDAGHTVAAQLDRAIFNSR